MKKTVSVLLSLLLILSLLTGCGNFTDRTSGNNQPVPPAPAEAIPAEPAAAASAPVEPAPAEPVAVEPTPAEPTPAEPVAVESAPAEPVPAEPGTDPGLTFTWDDLVRANLLSSILTRYPSVCITNPLTSPDESIRLFLYQGEPVMISEGPDYLNGQYRGAYFEFEDTGDGECRPVIGGFNPEDGNAQMETFLLDYISEPAIIQLDRIEGDLIWADCIYSDGYSQKLAVDRGTLVLRKIVSMSGDGQMLDVTDFDYQNEIRVDPDYGFLGSWDLPLRAVTVTWENYYAGRQELRTETYSIPQDWELLPWEGRWGDYTVYMNDDYIGGYEYPGDGVDYYLFLTTVKG